MDARHPLDGLRIAVTRAAEQCAALAVRLRAAGAEPLTWPLIAFEPEPAGMVAAACGPLRQYDWVVFSSANGARFFCDRPGMDAWPPGVRVAAVGPQTAAALDRRGIQIAAMPAEYRAAQITAALGPVRGLRVLIVRPADAPGELVDALTDAGAHVSEVVAYRTIAVPPPQPLGDVKPDVITLASGSAAASLARALGGAALPEAIAVASIGPSTTAVARHAGLPVHIEAAEHTLDGLTAALVSHYSGEARH